MLHIVNAIECIVHISYAICIEFKWGIVSIIIGYNPSYQN